MVGMVMRMLPPVLLLCLGAATVCSTFYLAPPHVWTKLILTHVWPETFCNMSAQLPMQHCHAKVNHWTLHGLWPNKGQFCNSSWEFNSTLIEDLMPDLMKSWPNLFNQTSTDFWKYEWNKHGTCAGYVESLNSEHKYFGKALELYHKLDLDSVLKKFNIIPSAEYYSFSAIESVIENFYKVKPKIQCVHPTKGNVAQTLGQIEICFNPDFTLLACEKETLGVNLTKSVTKPSGFSVCDHDIPVYYPPLE